MAILSKVRKYVPEVGGNREKDEKEQFYVRLRSVDVHAKQARLRKFLSMTPEEITKSMMDEEGASDIKDTLFTNVVSFVNLMVDESEDEGTPKQRLATIQDMWALGEFELCLELFNTILSSSQLSGAERKNSKSQSGSTPAPAEVTQ